MQNYIIMDKEKNRIVVLIDMDCFYCQVEEKLNPDLKGKPIAVVQYNPWKGGGIIAVNYVARAMGVTRHMRGDEAKEKCPEIQLPSVPCQRGKADISKYRNAGKEVAKVLQRFTPLMERASIDEAYLDITSVVQERLQTSNINTVTSDMTPNSFALGYDSMVDFVTDVHDCGEDLEFDSEHATHLLVGALVVSEMRAAVYNETGYRCSAGIAHNKILAKLVCGMNKPDKQTVLPKHCVNTLYQTLPVKKVKHLGGKFGDTVCEVLRIKHMIELQQFSERDLQAKFDEKNGSWLYNIARGIDTEPVLARFNPKSIGCCKQFRGKSALLDLHSLKRWLKDLGDEIEDRLEKDALENSRSPRQMVVSYSVQVSGRDVSSSRSYNFGPDDELCGELFSGKALELVLDGTEGSKTKNDEGNRQLKQPIKFLGISVGKFEDHSEIKKTKKIKDYFAAGSSKEIHRDPKDSKTEETKVEKKDTIKSGKDHIMQTFLQKCVSKDIKSDVNNLSSDSNHKPLLESLLDKQESFFAKFLNNEKNEGGIKQTTISETNNITNTSEGVEVADEEAADGVETCNDDSNDTYCSGSTINEEINKSIALFEEDREGIDRVSSMRKLLNSTGKENEINTIEIGEPGQSEIQPQNAEHENTIECGECGKEISINMVDIHSDYHLALKLRDEYRQQARNEMKERTIIPKEVTDKDKTKKKTSTENMSNNSRSISSITNFLTKVDSTVPSKICTECGKRVANEKFMEHLDYHEAQKLSRQINRVHRATNTTTSSVKRKRKSESPTKKPKVPCKSINTFFKS